MDELALGVEGRMANQIQVGDVVKLKSGGPSMTVMDVLENGKVKTACGFRA